MLPDGKTLCLVSTPDKDAKEQLNQGRLREKRKELIIPCDRVLGENATQKEVYEQVRDCVRFPFLGEENEQYTLKRIADKCTTRNLGVDVFFALKGHIFR